MTKGNGLGDAYTATLTRLKAQTGNKSKLGLKVLMWVLYSERPLKAEELCHALGVELGSAELDHGNIPASRTLLASSLGLVTIEASSSTVRLVHFTLQEHLSSNSTLFHCPHSTIAEVCLTYLNFGCVRALLPTLLSAPAAMPLLEYAACYWGNHTRNGMTENIKILALRLLDKFDEHISAQLILWHYDATGVHLLHFDFGKGPIGFTGLHGAAFLGIVDILAAVLEMKEWDVNARDMASYTPLLWAAIKGHEEAVKVLLKREDINPDLTDHRRRLTPLSWAVLRGHEGVVRVFLEQEGINLDGADTQYSYTPLFLAASSGRAGIVKMLLEREDVNPNRVSSTHGTTPLSVAVERGHEGIVKMFLEREDINPNLADTLNGYTPLSYAAESGHEGMVRMLLERNDIRTDTRDKENQTPRLLALYYGYDKIARMISERADTNPNTADPSSQTSRPLSAEDGEESPAETRPGGDHPSTNMADPISQPTSPPAHPNTPEGLSDCQGSIPNSANSTIPSTEPPDPPPLKFWHSLRNIANTLSALSIVINRHWIIASLVCILAFLLYILPFQLSNVFSFHT